MKKVPPLTPTSKTFNKNNRLHLDVFPSRTGFNQPKEIPRVMLFLFAQGGFAPLCVPPPLRDGDPNLVDRQRFYKRYRLAGGCKGDAPASPCRP